MAEISRNAETTKIYSASLRVAILICDVKQVILATLMDSSEALTPKVKAGGGCSVLINIHQAVSTCEYHYAVVNISARL